MTNDKKNTKLSWEIQNYGKPVSTTVDPTASQHSEAFLVRSAVLLLSVISWCCQMKCRHLRDLCNSGNQWPIQSERSDAKCKVDFNVTKHERPADRVSDSTRQLTFKTSLPLVKFWCRIKEYSQLPAKPNKITLSLSTTFPCETRFASSPSNKTYFKRLNIKAVMRIQLPSIRPDIKKISKNVKQSHSSEHFSFEK